MKYISTRGDSPVLGFDETLLAGLAQDGGLYVPNSWPYFNNHDLKQMAELSYIELAQVIMKPFIGNTLSSTSLASILEDAYSNFDDDKIAPLKPIAENEYLLELFHGPTLAFKDIAMQFLGPLFEHFLTKKGKHITIVGATSGDTGSAAIEACRDRDTIDLFILYPYGRVSEIQQRQMTTVVASNIHCIAVDGTFDDCQDQVKSMFNDKIFRENCALSSINSINWTRIMAQTVYYFWAGLKLRSPINKISFSVPTGNFGNVFAGYVSKKMGLPIEKLIIASNKNDILTRFFKTKTMKLGKVYSTISPSMDIQISSNFERLLFELYDRDGSKVKNLIEKFRSLGEFSIDQSPFEQTMKIFDSASFDDNQTSETIKKVYAESGELIDPHTAVGVSAARMHHSDPVTSLITLATAHPAKFPDSVKKATTISPKLPKRLQGIFDKKEVFTRLENNEKLIKQFINDTLNKVSIK